MNAEAAREFLLTLPHVVETRQWGDNLVFWAGDKAIGGKMFALLNLDGPGLDGPSDSNQHGVISFAAGPERFHELVENEDLHPAPYFARIHWVAAGSWRALRTPEWHDALTHAHQLTYAKLPKRTKDVLALPARQRNQLLAARRKDQAAKQK